MQIRPLDAALGAAVTGIDVARRVDDAAFAALHEAWIDRAVLLFRGQGLDDPALVAFSRRFGDLDLPPASEHAARGKAGGAATRGAATRGAAGRSDTNDGAAPEVWIIANGQIDGRPLGALGAAEAEWHTDMSYLEEPPAASLLYALEVPDDAGHTSFASMTAALAALPADLRRQIEGRQAKHDGAYTSVGTLRQGAAPVADVTRSRGAVHPIVRTHPVSGRPALYLGRRRNAHISGLSVTDSDRLLDAVWAFCAQPRFVYRHTWQPGDLLVWDNRAVIHRRDAFDPALRRVMHRTQVKGDRPY